MGLNKIELEKLIDEIKNDNKLLQMKKTEAIGLRLYKLFGYPEIKELGININNNSFESIGEIYRTLIKQLPEANCIRQNNLPNGKGFILFTKDDILKLLKSNVQAVEMIISNDNKLLIINHYF